MIYKTYPPSAMAIKKAGNNPAEICKIKVPKNDIRKFEKSTDNSRHVEASASLVTLLEQMLNVSASKRVGLKDIVKSEWFTSNMDALTTNDKDLTFARKMIAHRLNYVSKLTKVEL
jgi:hypothetical protein